MCPLAIHLGVMQTLAHLVTNSIAVNSMGSSPSDQTWFPVGIQSTAASRLFKRSHLEPDASGFELP